MNYKNITRKDWIKILLKITLPILERSANGYLKKEMPKGAFFKEDQYLEAIGRIICGIAPWIECKENGSDFEYSQKKYVTSLIVKTIDNITQTNSPDYINFAQSAQALVDTAYLVQGFLRSPILWHLLGKEIQERLILEILKTRKFNPGDNNWLLFASIIEAFFLKYSSVPIIKKRLNKGLKYFSTFFYMGDGMYGDGITFSMDYYNSYVIHPMMLDILQACINKTPSAKYNKLYKTAIVRFRRFVEIQERTVSSNGTYPIYGRTQICRLGSFQALSYSIYKSQIPESLSKSQIKGCLNSLLCNFMDNNKNFDDHSFLTIGINGSQPGIAENYVSYGSAYHICNFFLCLALPATDSFWTCQATEWTSLKLANGTDIPQDHALDDVPYRHIVVNTIKKLIYLLKLRLHRYA